MATTDPAELETQLAELVESAKRIHADYAWAYDLGLTPAHGDSGIGKRSDISDPTLATVMDLRARKARRSCESVSRNVEIALTALQTASYALQKAFPASEASELVETPQIVSEAELEAAVAAQARRRLRGER